MRQHVITSNSPIDWTNFMTPEDKEDYKKSQEFRDWLNEMLSSNIANITFTKKDGTKRVMKCTRNFGVIPTDQHPKNGSVESTSACRVFDVEKQEWRSFVYENVERFEYDI